VKIHFHVANTEKARNAYDELIKIYGNCEVEKADVIVAVGGDGSMLRALHESIVHHKPVYGMNRGTVGFLMNDYKVENLQERLANAHEIKINPLRMKVKTVEGNEYNQLAINEVSMLRETRQAAKLSIVVDNRVRMENLICDGVIVATPAGSTAYNSSVHGSIIPLEAELLSLAPISAFRPRRWRGALVSQNSTITIEVKESDDRYVSAVADFFEVRDAKTVEVSCDKSIVLSLLFDPDMNLDERIIKEQFLY